MNIKGNTVGGAPGRKRQRGHFVLEGALVMIPFFAIFMALIDFGIAIFLRTTFQHAVREGVRYGVTYQMGAGMGHDDSIRSIVVQNSLGFLAGNPTNYITVKYYDPNNNLLETASNRPGNILEVSVVNYNFGVVAPLLRSANPIPISARASDRMESLPAGLPLPNR